MEEKPEASRGHIFSFFLLYIPITALEPLTSRWFLKSCDLLSSSGRLPSIGFFPSVSGLVVCGFANVFRCGRRGRGSRVNVFRM